MNEFGACPQGHYCPAASYFSENGLDYRRIPCPSGAYGSAENSTEVAACTTCPEKKYCGSAGLSAVSGDCAAGYFCTSGATEAKPPNDTNTGLYGPCPAGHYCTGVSTDAAAPAACSSGQFSAVVGASGSSACASCPEGSYCPSTGLTEPYGECTPGYYCAEGASSATASSCSSGSYCPKGAAFEQTCPPGFYISYGGQSKCLTCPTGNTCVGSTKTPCPVGYVCP